MPFAYVLSKQQLNPSFWFDFFWLNTPKTILPTLINSRPIKHKKNIHKRGITKRSKKIVFTQFDALFFGIAKKRMKNLLQQPLLQNFQTEWMWQKLLLSIYFFSCVVAVATITYSFLVETVIAVVLLVCIVIVNLASYLFHICSISTLSFIYFQNRHVYSYLFFQQGYYCWLKGNSLSI